MRIHSPQITGSAANTNIVLTTITSSISVLSSSFANTASFVVSSSNDAAQNTRLSVIESVTGSFTSTSSFGAYTASNDLVNVTQSSRLSTIESVTGSYATTSSFGTYTASNDLTNATQSARLSTIESVTGSYATTSSNIFKSSQVITGSLTITNDLTVLGSSSIQYITSSQLNISNNLITVNTLPPSVRFGGFAVIDSGSSPQTSGSLLFDSEKDQWVFVHQNQGIITSSVLLMGPETYDNLGNEAYLGQNKLIKSTGIEHLADSNITDTGTKVSINSNTEITGSLISTVGFTGSLFGTASYALQANSASFALTASYISGSGAGVGFPFSGSAIITGSLFVSGSTISGSFKGDGSQITGLTAGGKIHTQSSAASTWTVSHNLGVQYPNVTVYNASNEVIIPQTITATDANTLTLTFGSAVAGYAVSGIGGIINVQGRTTQQYFAAATTWSFAHNLGDRYVSIQAFDDAFEMMIPTTIRLVDATSSIMLFESASSGYAVATIGGDLPAISSSYAGYTLQVANSAPYSASWVAVPNVTVTTAQTASYANNFIVSGSVGIGTNLPSGSLHIIGANATNRGQLSIQSNNIDNAARVSFYYHTALQGNIGTTSSDFYNEAINNYILYAGGSERMRISSAGNVGIGTTTPGTLLHVSGSSSIIIPVGTTAQRNAVSSSGMIRINSTFNKLEFFNNSTWNVVKNEPVGTYSDPITDLQAFDQLSKSEGTYYFRPPNNTSSGSIIQMYYKVMAGNGFVRVFSSPYNDIATVNLINLNIPLTQLLIQKNDGAFRTTAGWNDGALRYFNTRNTTGDLTTTGDRIGFRIYFGYAGGHGIYNTAQLVCSWGASDSSVGAGYDGGECGTFPNGLRWGTGTASPTYDNRSGTWELWVRW